MNEHLRKSRTNCSLSRLHALVFLWRRRVYGGSCATSHFRRCPNKFLCRFVRDRVILRGRGSTWSRSVACGISFAWQAQFFGRSTLYTLHSTLYTLMMLHTLHFTLSTHLYTFHSTLYTLHSTLCTPHFALHTLHFTLRTLHSTLYTLHSTLYTTHSTLYTAHFEPYTLNFTL